MSPHLIHIGYPKTGSTFLQRWFEAHPQLGYVEGGIAGFRSAHEIASGAFTAPRDPRYRVTSYEGLSRPAPYVAGDTSPAGVLPPKRAPRRTAQAYICETLGEVFPGSRVLVVTRGFRAMIMSSYSRYVTAGGEADLEELIATADSGDDRDDWNYDRVIGLYAEKFGRSNVLVVPYELLREDHRRFLGVIECWLGLDAFDFQNVRINASLSAIELRWYPRFARTLLALPIGAPLQRRVLKLYVRAALRHRLRVPIRILQRLHPLPPVTAALVADALLEKFRGTTELLRGDPLYAPYAHDYLF